MDETRKSEFKKTFGRLLKAYRAQELKITQNEMAEKLGITPGTLSLIETGHDYMNMETFQRLVEIAGRYAHYMLMYASFGEEAIDLRILDMEGFAADIYKAFMKNMRGDMSNNIDKLRYNNRIRVDRDKNNKNRRK